ncbi:Methicillin resistance regulatory protein MecI [Aquisphaera giovannonii]|uniref:Methicillin resistance regulatory protein MecI n=1 Tax=Aquisphaera giovannonii TaxID=406548 RepID=A0A5B9W8V8_9BACT|nr:BlaI/MecI/CopY family transcriptional regulator [Aquisphaera giovannonii]QEH36714.1 Methicillin resistance regulatory protein MecI [Aquisphaera giovannonii]
MARNASDALTEREAEVMDALWRLGEATAEQVREAVPGAPHDSTVRTMLRILEAKGYVSHEARGKVYVYRAAVDRSKAQRQAVRGLLARFFGGSAEDLVLRLIEDESLTQEQLDKLRDAAQPAADPPSKRRKKGDRP